MARRSRTITDTIKQEFRVWRIAIYIRLSKEDARNNDESESVSNQRAIIEEHTSSAILLSSASLKNILPALMTETNILLLTSM